MARNISSIHDTQKDQVFTRRRVILGAVQGGLLLALGGRLFTLTVLQSKHYTNMAEENRVNLRLVLPARGRIYDRNGEILALNRQNFRILMVSEQAGDLNSALDSLSLLVDVSQADRDRVLRDVKQKHKFVPVIVREDLNLEEVARIEINEPDLPGISIDSGQSRFYPKAEAFGHLLGYVGPLSEQDRIDNEGDPLFDLPDFRLGKNGIEAHYEEELRGKPEIIQVEVNAVGRVSRELSRTEGKKGDDLELTIDANLQEFAMRRVGDESAAVVVMDVHSGEVQALVSAPAYDPNGFTQGMRSNTWNELLANPRNPLTNKAIAGQYSPGSTFKMVTAMAGLDAGAISATTMVNCTGTYEFGDTIFHCWNRRGHGLVGLDRAIKESCDVYFYETSKRTGIDALAAMARRFGIGEPLGIDLMNEKGGLMPDKAWKLKALNRPWIIGETLSCGIGQSYVQTTPLQLATMTARLVTGRAVVPRLTHRVGGRFPDGMTQAPFDDLRLNPEQLRMVNRGMAAVVNQPGGTAYASRLNESGWEMGGKTGSAQVRRITKQDRARGLRPQQDLPWEERDNALFVGYAPLAAPRYAVAVVVEHGMHGSWVAPIARDILLETLRRDQGLDVRSDQPRTKGIVITRAERPPPNRAETGVQPPQNSDDYGNGGGD